MPSAVKTYSHNVYSHYKSDFNRQREVKNHNLLSACLSAIANVPKNISISKTLQKTTADLARSNANRVDIPIHSFNNRGIMTLNENRVKFEVNTASNMNRAIITFENRYKTDSLSGKNLEAYNVLKDKIKEFKTNFVAQVENGKAVINCVETCAEMVDADTINPVFNAMLNKYTKLNESPVRQTTNLDVDTIRTSLANILNTEYSTSDINMAISEQGNAAGQIIKRFLSSSRSVHISDASIARLEQPAFNEYMNQRLQELPVNDRELTLSLYKAFTTNLNKNILFDKDFTSTFFGQAIIVANDFVKSCHTETGSFKGEGRNNSVRVAINSTYEKFIAYVKTTFPEINPPA
ncbi:hypothetical protein [Citrobacter sp. Cy070]|nr:hypothetical protein [Citrobacter sp. Cy070]MDM2730257.1 hypothetical protein [Citrobacter sp. Cy070]